MIDFCPECGNVAYYNPHFGKHNCTVCRHVYQKEVPPMTNDEVLLEIAQRRVGDEYKVMTLEDYEALQAKNERLRDSLEKAVFLLDNLPVSVDTAYLKKDLSPASEEPPEGERCQSCGKRYDTVWRAPDPLWARVSGEAGMLCPECFDERAKAQGIALYWECAEGEYPTEDLSDLFVWGHEVGKDLTREDSDKILQQVRAQQAVCEAARAYLQAWERNRKVEHDESVSDDEWYAANQAVLGAWSEFVEAVKRLEEVEGK